MTDPIEGYDGPARLLTEDRQVEVAVTLRGAFQPIDGRYHWYGRVSRHDDVDGLGAGAQPRGPVVPLGVGDRLDAHRPAVPSSGETSRSSPSMLTP